MGFLDFLKENIAIEKALLREYEIHLPDFPKGKLNCKQIRGKPEYYLVAEDGSRSHIHPQNEKLVVQLRTKAFMEKGIPALKKNLKLQERLLKGYRDCTLSELEKSLPDAYREDKLLKWMHSHYRANPYHLENRIYQTSFGLSVRSKSEILIAELLHAAHIPFHYDEEVVLQDSQGKWHTFYVDFIILTPQGKKLYWEHFGLFHDEDYRKKSFVKIGVFFDNDIVPADTLIITMDTPQKGLDTMTVSRTIKGQILPYFGESEK